MSFLQQEDSRQCREDKQLTIPLNVLSNFSLPDTAAKGQQGLKFTSQPAGSSRCDQAVSLGAAAAAAKPAAQGFADSAPGNETTARDLPRLYSAPDRVWGERARTKAQAVFCIERTPFSSPSPSSGP